MSSERRVWASVCPSFGESMEAMGGIVSVESVEGEGTTFALSGRPSHDGRAFLPRPPKSFAWHFPCNRGRKVTGPPRLAAFIADYPYRRQARRSRLGNSTASLSSEMPI